MTNQSKQNTAQGLQADCDKCAITLFLREPIGGNDMEAIYGTLVICACMALCIGVSWAITAVVWLIVKLLNKDEEF